MGQSTTKRHTFAGAKEATAGFDYKGISDPLAEALFQRAKLVPADEVILEIGSFVGYSTIYLAYGSLAGNKSMVHCIDPWGLPPSTTYSQVKYKDQLGIDDSTHKKFLTNIDEAGVAEIVAWHRAYGHKYSSKWPRQTQIGMLFIDGDHSEWGVYADWYHYKKFLASGATIAFHDYGHWAVQKMIKQIPESQIRDPQVVGTGYKGNEALVFNYIEGNERPLRDWLHYALLSLRPSAKE